MEYIKKGLETYSNPSLKENTKKQRSIILYGYTNIITCAVLIAIYFLFLSFVYKILLRNYLCILLPKIFSAPLDPKYPKNTICKSSLTTDNSSN